MLIRQLFLLPIFLVSNQLHAVKLTILHSNDLHSQLEGSGPDAYVTPERDQDPVQGHFARLAHAIRLERQRAQAAGEAVLLLDAGDFYSGSLFHTLGPDPAFAAVPELEYLAAMNYDAIALGNHEFDAGEQGLATMLKKARNLKLDLPILASNLILSTDSLLSPFAGLEPKSGQAGLYRRLLKDLVTPQGKLRVGLLGVLGPDAALVSRTYRRSTRFVGYHEERGQTNVSELAAQLTAQVQMLRHQGAQVVIVLMHAGNPEDEQIAQQVADIDIIISGHTHKRYLKTVGKTLISQAGCYGRYLGIMKTVFADGQIRLRTGSQHKPIDDQTPMDEIFFRRIEQLKEFIDDQVDINGFHYRDRAGRWKHSLKKKFNSPKGIQMVAMSGVRKALQVNGLALDAYFSADGLVRVSYRNPSEESLFYQFSDLFRALSLGIGPDQEWGYQPVHFFMRGEEFKHLIEFSEVNRRHAKSYGLVFSDSVLYRIERSQTEISADKLFLHNQPYDTWPELLHVGTNTHVLAYLQSLNSFPGSHSPLIFRNAAGQIVSEPYTAGPMTEAALWMLALTENSQE